MEHTNQCHSGGGVGYRSILAVIELIQDCRLDVIVTMKPSATLETAGVSEIGRRSFSKSCTGFFFGKGVASAVFHIDGKRCSLKEALRISITGKATKSEYSFRSQFGIWSGPDALLGLSLASTFAKP